MSLSHETFMPPQAAERSHTEHGHPTRVDPAFALMRMKPAALLQLAFAQEQEHALILLDANARVVDWSAAAARSLGWDGSEMVRQTLERLFTPEDLARGDLDWELRTATSYGKAEDDRWQVRKDGTRIWASGILTRLVDDTGALVGFVKILRDRTDVRAQIDALQARLAQATSIEHQKEVLLGTLAHELRGPLGPLSNATHMIELAGADNPKIAACVQIIQRQVRFIESVVDDLLESTRVAVGKVKLHYERVEVRAAIDHAIETCSALLRERDQKVEVLISDVPRIDADPVRIRQVIVNLLTNSSKFSPSGTTIWVKVTVEGEEIVLRVEDHGKGIPAALLPRIFELFTQAVDEGGANGRGLGLGLGLVKAIIELHGGTVQAKSEGADKGAEIIVRLPMSRKPLDLGEHHGRVNKDAQELDGEHC